MVFQIFAHIFCGQGSHYLVTLLAISPFPQFEVKVIHSKWSNDAQDEQDSHCFDKMLAIFPYPQFEGKETQIVCSKLLQEELLHGMHCLVKLSAIFPSSQLIGSEMHVI